MAPHGIGRFSSSKDPRFNAEVYMDGPGDGHKADRRLMDLCRRHGKRPRVARIGKDGTPIGDRADERYPGQAPDDLQYHYENLANDQQPKEGARG